MLNELELEQNAKEALLTSLHEAESMLHKGKDSQEVLDFLHATVWNEHKTGTQSRNMGHMVGHGIACR